MTGEVDVRLLGPVDVLSGGRSVPLGGPRQRRLLSLLASDNGRVVSIDRIVDELWTGDPPPSAEATLRTYVSRLRRVIGVDAVVARSRGYSLEVEPECIDARRFERLLAEGRCSLEQGAAGAAADRLTAALDLWRGPAYGDVGDTAEPVSELVPPPEPGDPPVNPVVSGIELDAGAAVCVALDEPASLLRR